MEMIIVKESLIDELEKEFSCIFGGEKSPTPFGVFQVEHKTTDEYVSGYYPEHDKVKFFGYLIIFEDYFIHSDLYDGNVTADAMRNENQYVWKERNVIWEEMRIDKYFRIQKNNVRQTRF